MAWDLATAKRYLKIDPADTTRDVAIQGVMDYVFGSVETVLQRGLLFRRQTIIFQYVESRRFYLPRPPVANVFKAEDGNGGALTEYTLHSRSGWIQFLVIPKSPLTIEYDGGYQILPPDLERCLWEAFMDAYNRTDPDTGGPLTNGGTPMQTAGDVKSLTVFDGFKVDYDVGATVPGQDPGAARDQYEWGWLAPWAAILSFYRSVHGTGLGIA